MKYNKGFVSVGIIIAIIALLVVGGVAYYFGKNSNAPVQNIQENNNQAQSSTALTQPEAETLVHSTWSDCSQGDCASVTVTVTQNSRGQYVATAIFVEYDDSIALTKREAVATYQNGIWVLGQATIAWACHPNRGHQNFSTAPCI